MTDYRLICGDCRDVIPTLPDKSIDAIICDPPYPCISRPYGMMTEADWHAMMRVVVLECRRVLKPTGSAVFILQPNYETPGRMRPWVWEFMAWAAREWNVVQDAYWLNTSPLPTQGCQRRYGLMRPAVKPCVWLGEPDCYRDQDAVIWDEAEDFRIARLAGRFRPGPDRRPSGKVDDRLSLTKAAAERGGVTPLNVIPVSTRDTEFRQREHSSPIPRGVVDYWIRYITPPSGMVCDPFSGVGIIGLAALKRGRSFIGIEAIPEYVEIARRRLDALVAESPLFTGPSAPLASSEATR